MRALLAIVGLSGVGKTSSARLIAERLRLPLRSCGELVKARALELGVDGDSLSSGEHAAIDLETRRLATTATSPLIIEGRYLERVLREVPSLMLLELTCDEVERQNRLALRSTPAADVLQRHASGNRGARIIMKGEVYSYNTDGVPLDVEVEEIIKLWRHKA